MSYRKEDGIYWFFKFILGDMTYAGYPEPIFFNKLWLEWSKLRRLGNHIAIKCGRQQGKSTYWTCIETVYRASMFKNYNVLIESASENQAIDQLSKVISIIVNNEFLVSKRAKSAKWSTTDLVYNGGVIRARGVGSEVRGGTYDYVVNDDILRSDNKLSDEGIERFIDEELEPMILVRKGQMVIVGTPKNSTDIFNTIEERIGEGAKWILKTYPAITDWEKKELLCPDRFTWEQLMAIREVQTHKKFDKEFLCKTYASGSQLFPPELRTTAKKRGARWTMYQSARPEDAKEWRYYIGVDTARSGAASADYTVVVVLAYNPETQEKRLVWYWRRKGLKISDQVQKIAEISRNFNNPVILVERNNLGQEFIEELVDNYNCIVESFLTTKGTKFEDLIRGLINSFENEKMILPQGDRLSKEMVNKLDKELDRFVVEITKAGNEVFKGSGHSHDDLVIALALANRCSQSFGYKPFAATFPSRHTTPLERFVASGDLKEVIRF